MELPFSDFIMSLFIEIVKIQKSRKGLPLAGFCSYLILFSIIGPLQKVSIIFRARLVAGTVI